jgi:DNA-binding transcriptional ArsR family regulator
LTVPPSRGTISLSNDPWEVTVPAGLDDSIAHLRATAHPLRLRMLSLLTGQAMSAAEVARALDVTHANASYHLRLLHDAGELVVEGEEKIRGGVAKRYRYDATRCVPDRTRGIDERIADARATAIEVERRLLDAAKGSASSSDLEAWVPVQDWHRALDLLHEASHLLHAAARPDGTPDTVHISVTTTAFTMEGGLTGEAARWTPSREDSR